MTKVVTAGMNTMVMPVMMPGRVERQGDAHKHLPLVGPEVLRRLA